MDPELRHVVLRDLWGPVAETLQQETGLDLSILGRTSDAGPLSAAVDMRTRPMFQRERRRVEVVVRFVSGPIHEVRLSGILYLVDPPRGRLDGWMVRKGQARGAEGAR